MARFATVPPPGSDQPGTGEQTSRRADPGNAPDFGAPKGVITGFTPPMPQRSPTGFEPANGSGVSILGGDGTGPAGPVARAPASRADDPSGARRAIEIQQEAQARRRQQDLGLAQPPAPTVKPIAAPSDYAWDLRQPTPDHEAARIRQKKFFMVPQTPGAPVRALGFGAGAPARSRGLHRGASAATTTGHRPTRAS